jgi:8-oxo-dGTP diphosphatase
MSQTGDELLLYRPGTAPAPLREHPDLPLVFACAVARHRGEVLFVFNRRRKLWELPAGLIEPGETAEAAAMRELAEESGQVVSALSYAGLALLRLKRDGRLELGAMYTCELDALQPFRPNEEIGAILLWDLKRPIIGEADRLSCELVELVRG